LYRGPFSPSEEKECRLGKYYRHGLGKDVVYNSAPPNGSRDTQHPTWRKKRARIV
jgi:hypothetical protein